MAHMKVCVLKYLPFTTEYKSCNSYYFSSLGYLYSEVKSKIQFIAKEFLMKLKAY